MEMQGNVMFEYSVSYLISIIYGAISILIAIIFIGYKFDSSDLIGFIIFLMVICMVVPLMYYLYKLINEGKKLGSGKYVITSSGIYFIKGNKEIFIDFKDVKYIYINEAKLSKFYTTFLKVDETFAFSNRVISVKLNNNELISLSVPTRLFGELITVFESILKTHSNINLKHEK